MNTQKQKQDQEQRERDSEERKRVTELQADREKSNNPATQQFRQYDKDAPGMHPANLPADRLGDERPVKGTRLDLEDVTGNPGHRMVNPDAPATSINPGPNQLPSAKERDALAKQPPTRSINEPVDVEPPPRAEQFSAGQGVQGSINEPPGSQIGSNMDPTTGKPITGGEEAPLVLSSISPESVPLQADGLGTFALTATGSGFTQDCVIVLNDEDCDTTFVSDTELRADAAPTDTIEGTVDVEVARGDELSEAITFDFTAAAGRAAGKKSARKPSKGKRDKSKVKSKSRR